MLFVWQCLPASLHMQWAAKTGRPSPCILLDDTVHAAVSLWWCTCVSVWWCTCVSVMVHMCECVGSHVWVWWCTCVSVMVHMCECDGAHVWVHVCMCACAIRFYNNWAYNLTVFQYLIVDARRYYSEILGHNNKVTESEREKVKQGTLYSVYLLYHKLHCISMLTRSVAIIISITYDTFLVTGQSVSIRIQTVTLNYI